MLKNIGTDRDYILSLEAGRVRIRAVSPKARAEIDTFRHEVHQTGASIDNYVLENFISCYSQLNSAIDVLAAIKGELESRGCTVALPTYEAEQLEQLQLEQLEKKPSTGEETIMIVCDED